MKRIFIYILGYLTWVKNEYGSANELLIKVGTEVEHKKRRKPDDDHGRVKQRRLLIFYQLNF